MASRVAVLILILSGFIFLQPDFVRHHVSLPVVHGLVARNFHVPGNGLNHPLQIGLHAAGVCARNSGGIHLVDVAANSIGNQNDPGWMRCTLDRFVFKVDSQRRQEDEQQDERDHDVILDAAALVTPPDEVRDGSPKAPHRRAASSVESSCYALQCGRLRLTMKQRRRSADDPILN